MTRLRLPTLIAVAISLLLSIGGCTMMQKEPEMAMRGSPVTVEMNDREAAAAYTSEAAILYENARTHRKMAQHYRARVGGKMDFSQIVRHCETLAQQYENAAKEAEALSSELSM